VTRDEAILCLNFWLDHLDVEVPAGVRKVVGRLAQPTTIQEALAVPEIKTFLLHATRWHYVAEDEGKIDWCADEATWKPLLPFFDKEIMDELELPMGATSLLPQPDSIQNVLLSSKLTQILAHHDPVGLIRAGAPPDEYSPEVPAIVAWLQQAQEPTVDQTAEAIRQVFTEMFGASVVGTETQQYRAAAQELLEIWNKNKPTKEPA